MCDSGRPREVLPIRASQRATCQFGIMIRNLVAFTAAALLEILGCFTFWLWLRRGASPTIAAVGIFSLIGFAVALTYGGRRSRLCVRQERRRSARARVRRVILPRPGRKTLRRAHERQRWFRREQRWRVGCEGRISVHKP